MEKDQQSESSDIISLQEEDDKWTHPRHIFQRLLALVLMCLIGFGKYFYNYFIYNAFYECLIIFMLFRLILLF